MRLSSKPVGTSIYNREQPAPEYDPGFAPWAKSHDVVFREGRGLVAVFDFGTLPASQLNVKAAISGVSEANARANLEAQAPGWDFDAQRTAAALPGTRRWLQLRSRQPSPFARCCIRRCITH